MKIIKGKGVYGGIAIGKAMCFGVSGERVKRIKIDNSENELKRLFDACETAKQQLQKLYDEALY